MTRPGRSVLVVAALISLTLPLGAQRQRPAVQPETTPPPAPPSDIRVRSELSQTAAWVGDPVDYIVEIDLAPGVEVVAGDLLPERLAVEGLELGAPTMSTTFRADGWRTERHRYRVTAWDTMPPKHIGELTLRFRRPVTTTTADGTSPAAEITVPGVSLAVRSTLPDDGSADGARDRGAALPAPAWIGWLRPIGIGFIALGIAPAALWLAARARRPRVTRPRPSPRSLQSRVTTLFDQLQGIDIGAAAGRLRAYDRIDADLRAYLAESEAVPATALTSDELRTRLSASSRMKTGEVCDILAECEHARYAPADRLPSADALGGTIARLRNALGH